MLAGKMSELEYDLGRRGDAPILPYIIGLTFPIGGLGLALKCTPFDWSIREALLKVTDILTLGFFWR